MTFSTLIKASYALVTDLLIPIAFALCLLYFFWGVAKYIKSEGSGKAEGRQIMIWGVVALFVASSIWGIIVFIRNEVGLKNVPVEIKPIKPIKP